MTYWNELKYKKSALKNYFPYGSLHKCLHLKSLYCQFNALTKDKLWRSVINFFFVSQIMLEKNKKHPFSWEWSLAFE